MERDAMSDCQHEFIGVIVFNSDYTASRPCKYCGAEMRKLNSGRVNIITGGFTNPYGLSFYQPDGLEWILMREAERDYNTDALALDENSVIVDIGAHVGVVSMTLAKRHGCRVYAYEPQPENYRRLLENIALNGLGHLIIPHPYAVTGDGRDVTISHDERNSGGGSIYKGTGEWVKSVTLPDILAEVGGRIDLLKIDCEGAEYEIFEGADLSGIKAIRAEFHGEKATDLLQSVWKRVGDTRAGLA
jgi:FkbM family methyltransferase